MKKKRMVAVDTTVLNKAAELARAMREFEEAMAAREGGENVSVFDVIMPNGKRFGDLTKEDCAQFAEVAEAAERLYALLRKMAETATSV